jgi:hypothetical protein
MQSVQRSIDELSTLSQTRIISLSATETIYTQRSPNMIEMPVLFYDQSGAVAYTNNVINSIVDGSTLLVARPHGPEYGSGFKIFDDYVEKAANRVGFTTVLFNEERVYHKGIGSIHCGTNVMRLIPDSDNDQWWNNL